MSICAFIVKAQYNGIPLLKNYEPSVYNASPQNWEIEISPTGVILVANDYGLVTYDGLNWNLYEEELKYITKCLKRIDDQYYIGSENDIFTISTDSSGQLIFPSALPSLPDSLLDFGIVSDIVKKDDHFLFNSENFLFHFQGEKLNYAYSDDAIQNFYLLGNTVFASVEGRGLMRLEEGQLINSNAYSYFIDNPVIEMWKEGSSYFTITENGLIYELTIDQYGFIRKLDPHTTTIDPILKNNPIDEFWILNDSLVAIATQDNGLLVIKNWDQVIAHLNSDAGLQDELVHDIFQDRYGSIWLALSNGISKVDLSYPIRVFDIRNELEGTVEDITVYKGKTYAATHAGLYEENNGVYKSVYPEQVWDVQPFYTEGDSLLLMATNNDISELAPDGRVSVILECYPWKMYQLKKHKNTLLIGTDPGLTAAKYENGEWLIGQDNLNVNSPINNFNETPEGVYLGSRFNEPYLFTDLEWIDDSTDYKNLELFDENTGIPEGEMNVFSWKGKDYIGSYGAYSQTGQSNFSVDTFKGLDPKALFHRVVNNNENELWCITLVDNNFQFGFVDAFDQWNYELFNPIAKDIVHSIYIPDSSSVLFGGAGGIFKFNRNNRFDYQQNFHSLVTEVTVMEDSVIHNGYWMDSNAKFSIDQPAWSIPEFHYQTNAISFRYSSPTFGNEEDISYSYYLEGNDKQWSKWTKEHKKEYTNLPPGEYTFKVKAQNVFEVESVISSYRFVIKKPWFQTAWYYTLQTAVLLLLVFLTVFLNRSGNPSPFSSIIAFVTIITVFEFIIMTVEPFLEEYTGEIPVFNLIMNVLMAASLAPVEKLIRNYLASKKE